MFLSGAIHFPSSGETIDVPMELSSCKVGKLKDFAVKKNSLKCWKELILRYLESEVHHADVLQVWGNKDLDYRLRNVIFILRILSIPSSSAPAE